MKRSLISLTAAGLMLSQIAGAHAATFAQFTQNNPGSDPSVFLTSTVTPGVDPTISSTLSSGGVQPIKFNFTVPTAAFGGNNPGNGVLLADVTYTASSNEFAAPFGTTNSTYAQPYNSVSLTITGINGFINGVAYNDAKFHTLLTMTATATVPTTVAGTLVASNKGNGATFSGSDQAGFPLVVTFASSYLSITHPESYSLSYTGPEITTSSTLGGTPPFTFPFYYFNNFNEETTGTFYAQTSPEPGTLSMLMGLGISGGILLRRRRR